MKKWIVGSLVGAILVFGWQTLSWTMLGLHNDAARQHPQQDVLLEAITSTTTEEGSYMIPTLAPGTSMEEMEKFWKDREGKPWATMIYHPTHEMDMVMPMVRGFLVDLSLVVILIYLLTLAGTPAAARIVIGSLAVGLFTWLWSPYTGHIWFDLPWSIIMPDLIDALVAWGVCGLWLAWWLRR